MAKAGQQEQIKCLQEQLDIAQQSLKKIVHCCSDEGQEELKAEMEKDGNEYKITERNSFLIGSVYSEAEIGLSEIERLGKKSR